MIRFRALFLATICVSLFAADALAQRPFERLQRSLDEMRPRGRLLKELFGQDDEKQKNKQKSQRNGRNQEPTLAEPRPNNNAADQSARRQPQHPNELGIAVQEQKDNSGLLITQISSRGAAHAAGIQRGDKIIAIGGIEITSKQGLQDITKILQPGDQIEFEIVRRGKKQKALVQFGEAPQPADDTTSNQPNDSSTPVRQAANSSVRRGARSLSQNQKRAEHVAQHDDYHGLSSVLSGPITRIPSAQGNANPRTTNWQVAPPDVSSRRKPLFRKASSANPQSSATGQTNRMGQLQQQLQSKQQEIEMLRQQLRNQSTPAKPIQRTDTPSLGGPG